MMCVLVFSVVGKVYTLGRADYGRLGLGEGCGEKSEPTLVESLKSETCVDVAAGGCVSFAVTKVGKNFSCSILI